MKFYDDSERLLAISGIVISSMLLIVMTLLRGRRMAAHSPEPFVQPSRPYTPPSAPAESPSPTEPSPSIEGA